MGEFATMNATTNPGAFLRSLFGAALEAAAPERCLADHLPPPPSAPGRTIVLGAGKAAAAMARAVEARWHAPLTGLVVTPHGHAVECDKIEVLEASHPWPGEAGRDAAQRIMDLATDLGPEDLVLALISGGGSALLTLPAPGLTLEDKQAVTESLLRSGASITEINAVRKHLSAIKGGRLALRCAPARVITLAISDVPGDDEAAIASGPTVADPTSFANASAVVAKYAISPPPAVAAYLEAGAEETPKPGDPRLAHTAFRIVGRSRDALEAAAARAEQAGLAVRILGDDLGGEARGLAPEHAKLALEIAGGMAPSDPPVLVLSGGETTVTLGGAIKGAGSNIEGRGGRNTEYLLALAIALAAHSRIYALSCDTDGIDGRGAAAGAVLAPDSLERAVALGLDAAAMLECHDSQGFFEPLGNLVKTGPTRTNVNDFRATLVLPQGWG